MTKNTAACMTYNREVVVVIVVVVSVTACFHDDAIPDARARGR